MSKQEIDILSLENEIATVEVDAVEEEKYNAKKNYSILKMKIDSLERQIPYPNRNQGDTGDYSEIPDIQYEKSRNRKLREGIEEVSEYYDSRKLYSGHVGFDSGTEYFFTEQYGLLSREFSSSNGKFHLINVDDANYQFQVRSWRFPDEDKSVDFSRNILMKNKKVSDVDVISDNSNTVLSNITDAYLRKALIRNKNRTGIQSIIQTIQKKQDDIRSLSEKKSFIVQGCAGSGKTMVLLHRLRYLLYNKKINRDEYAFIVPSIKFKEFISAASLEFRINENNILPIQSYYELVAGKKKLSTEDTNESVFDNKYLSRIYSKEFMQEAYIELFNLLAEQTDKIIEICENKLNELIENEAITIEKEIKEFKSKPIAEIRRLTELLYDFVGTDITSLEDVPKYIDALCQRCEEKKEEINASGIDKKNIVISSDDIRILENKTLSLLKNEIIAEEEALEKASIFTSRAHKNKLEKIKQIYEETYKEVEAELIQEEMVSLDRQSEKSYLAFGEYTIENIETILENVKNIYEESLPNLHEAEKRKANLEEYLSEQFSEEIEYLNDLIEISAELGSAGDSFLAELTPSTLFFENNINLGTKLIDCFEKELISDDKKTIKDECKLFMQRSGKQLQAYLNTLLFNICKKKIKEEFNISLSNIYKHYWYIALYCRYLTRDMKINKYLYLFIDEGQDLSKEEINLICKINTIESESQKTTKINKPVINIFGDINQVITEHGINSWNDIEWIETVYELNENFRNPNQIVEYCNFRFPFKMEKIGVDMDEVTPYNSLKMAVKRNSTITDNAVLIVKDDYTKEDLRIAIEENGIMEYDIYTVKEVKGLEFKEIFVIDRDLSINEKYIAYTRALKKLNIIKTLPNVVDISKPLFFEGEDTEDLSD